MRLKDILWPWGAIAWRDDEIRWLEEVSDGRLRVLTIIESLRDANLRDSRQQREIAANLRSECLRLHKEIDMLKSSIRYAIFNNDITSDSVACGNVWSDYMEE